MKVELEIEEFQFVKALALHSALVQDREEYSEKYIAAAKKAICELHKQFVIDHKKYNDRDFKILSRIFPTINHYDFEVEDGDDYRRRSKMLDYKTLDRFDANGKLIMEKE